MIFDSLLLKENSLLLCKTNFTNYTNARYPKTLLPHNVNEGNEFLNGIGHYPYTII